MTLVDTSAWVEYDRATGSEADLRVGTLIRRRHAAAVTEPIVMEVLAGARDARREDDLRRLLARCSFVPFDSPTDFDSAVTIYRTCRAEGVTPRGLIDCMIAAVAMRAGRTLLAWDSDLVRVARLIDLELDPASIPLPP